MSRVEQSREHQEHKIFTNDGFSHLVLDPFLLLVYMRSVQSISFRMRCLHFCWFIVVIFLLMVFVIPFVGIYSYLWNENRRKTSIFRFFISHVAPIEFIIQQQVFLMISVASFFFFFFNSAVSFSCCICSFFTDLNYIYMYIALSLTLFCLAFCKI